MHVYLQVTHVRILFVDNRKSAGINLFDKIPKSIGNLKNDPILSIKLSFFIIFLEHKEKQYACFFFVVISP